jgi:K+-sensing histidine kinase KdpD
VRGLPYLVCAAAVALVGLAGHALTRLVPLPHVSILFLAPVVMSAAVWGFMPAVFAAVLSVAWGSFFFYAPIFSFRVADPQNVADLAVFLIVAAFTSRLAAGVRARALEAQRRQQTIVRLLAFSERLAECTTDAELNATIAEHLSPAAPAAAESPDPEYAKALLDRAAVALDRARLRREVADARVKMQGEALREALINSVSHDLQTPLAAILGSATALESFGPQGDAQASRELVATIREESERLASYIGNVLELTRIRSGQIRPRLEMVELSDIVDTALRRRRKALEGRTVTVDLPPDLPMVNVDLFLMEHALGNVLDNAAKYTRAGSALRLSASVHGTEVVLDVTDAGDGIRAEDLGRIFDPFFRGAGPEGQPPSGTGLGLAICRAFIEANGGSVVAVSQGPGRGATLRLRLPIPENAAVTEAALEADD